jgi:PAS domain S-box-containing protein
MAPELTAKPINRFIIAAFIIPLLLLAVAAWRDHDQLERSAKEQATRTAIALAEQATRVLEEQNGALLRLEERIAGMSDDEMRGSRELHQWLVRLASNTEYVFAISIVGADGRAVASSHVFPLPPLDARDREYFRVLASNPRAQFHINEPIIGRPIGEPVFQFARRRTSADGRFAGVVMASVRPEAIARFYREVEDAGDAVTLARADGIVLVREPAITTGVEKLPPASGLMRSIASDPLAGSYRTMSHLDEVDRFHAYRKVGRWPVYVSYGRSVQAVHAQWNEDLLLYGSAAVIAALLLLLVGSVAVSKARSEEAAMVRAREADALREAEERYRLAVRATNDAVWDWDLAAKYIHWTKAGDEYFGYAPHDIGTSIEWWVERLHPDDRARVAAGLRAVLAGAEEIWTDEYRLRRADGSYADVLDRGTVLRNEEGEACRMIGAISDQSERKRAEEAQKLLIAELQHRTRNLLAIVTSVARQTERASSSHKEFARSFYDRLAALSRVQSLLSRGSGHRVLLGELIEDELAAHGASTGDERISVDGPEVALSSKTVQVLTLALHELATNATKHGALRQDQAKLAIGWRVSGSPGEPLLDLKWVESRVQLPAERSTIRRGFGRELIERALPYDLGGETCWSLEADGVRCELRVLLDTAGVE